jgi:hypothetical protein
VTGLAQDSLDLREIYRRISLDDLESWASCHGVAPSSIGRLASLSLFLVGYA